MLRPSMSLPRHHRGPAGAAPAAVPAAGRGSPAPAASNASSARAACPRANGPRSRGSSPRCRRPGPRTPRSRPSRLTRRAPPARWSRPGRPRRTRKPLYERTPRRCQTAHHRPTRLPLSRIMRIRLHLRRPKRDGARRRQMRPCLKVSRTMLGPSRQAGCGAMSATCTATAGVIARRRRRHCLGPTRPTKKILEFNAGPRRSARPAYPPWLCVTPCCV